MPTILEYIDKAKNRHNLTSDSELDRKLDLKGSSVCIWRKGKSLPRPDTMRKLAELANEDPKKAIIELHTWNETDKKTRFLYLEILKALCISFLTLICSTNLATANETATSWCLNSLTINYATYGGA